MKQMCHVGKYLEEKCLWRNHIYLTPRLYTLTHFPNRDNKSFKHSKDPRNCPIILFFNSTHFVLISFILRDPVIVMPVSYNYMSIDNLGRIFKVQKNINKIYRTYHIVIHHFIYNLICNIKKHQEDEEKIFQQLKEESQPQVKVQKSNKGRIRRRGMSAKELQRMADEKLKKVIRERNVKIDFLSDKMSECLPAVTITL